MAKKPPAINRTEEQKARLEQVTRRHGAERRSVERGPIILACAEGKQKRELAVDDRLSLPRISKWRSRLANEGMRGLDKARRAGKPATYAQALNAGNPAVWRVLKKEGRPLHRARRRGLSAEPAFTEKAAPGMGRSLNPPLTALLLSGDEKPGIAALERKTGYVEPRDKTVVGAYPGTCKRQGSLNRFAALKGATGPIKAEPANTQRREDFQAFRERVMSD
jgi:hypothetical protein